MTCGIIFISVFFLTTLCVVHVVFLLLSVKTKRKKLADTVQSKEYALTLFIIFLMFLVGLKNECCVFVCDLLGTTVSVKGDVNNQQSVLNAQLSCGRHWSDRLRFTNQQAQTSSTISSFMVLYVHRNGTAYYVQGKNGIRIESPCPPPCSHSY